ncbi:MAG: STAS domain-containing protein [Chloroflexaceae bacterium]
MLDITGVVAVDTQVVQALIQTAQALRLLGCKVIITRISTEVAITIGERAQIELMNKLVREREDYLAQNGVAATGVLELLGKYQQIDLIEVEIQVPRSFFDCVFESMDVFDAAAGELARALLAILIR